MQTKIGISHDYPNLLSIKFIFNLQIKSNKSL